MNPTQLRPGRLWRRGVPWKLRPRRREVSSCYINQLLTRHKTMANNVGLDRCGGIASLLSKGADRVRRKRRDRQATAEAWSKPSHAHETKSSFFPRPGLSQRRQQPQQQEESEALAFGFRVIVVPSDISKGGEDGDGRLRYRCREETHCFGVPDFAISKRS